MGGCLSGPQGSDWPHDLPSSQSDTSRTAAPKPSLAVETAELTLQLSPRSSPGMSVASSYQGEALTPTQSRGFNSSFDLPSHESSHLMVYTYQELAMATNFFADEYKLGEGGFGSVYKAALHVDSDLPGVSEAVAIKSLNAESQQGHKEFMAEVNFLGALRHPNLVQLIGYCAQKSKRCLVYKFMPRGSLEQIIFNREVEVLPWSLRLRILLDAASGMAFLHSGASSQVIYRDFKSSNVLIDEDWSARLADFGLAKDGPAGEETHVTTRVVGTHGYVAPEYIRTDLPPLRENLVKWAAYALKDKSRIHDFMDPRLKGEFDAQQAGKVATLAQFCILVDAHSRKAPQPICEAEISAGHGFIFCPRARQHSSGRHSAEQLGDILDHLPQSLGSAGRIGIPLNISIQQMQV
eukprot:SM000026S08917  [mRNA]  locus=s26:459105:462149:- [translate_table: standard]